MENNFNFTRDWLVHDFNALKEQHEIAQQLNHDNGIIMDTGEQIQNIAKELIELNKAISLLNEMAIVDEEKINEIENSIDKTTDLIIDTMEILEEIAPKNKYDNDLKIIGRGTIGGVILGGIGGIFGIIPGIIGLGIGIGSGVITGYLI